MPTGFQFDVVRQKLALTKRVLPVKLAKQAENHFTESFTKGGLDNYKWQEVQRRTQGTRAYKYPSKPKRSSRTSPILVRTGNLRRKVSRSIHSSTWDNIRLVVDLPYAAIQNEGGYAGRNHSAKIPARPFMKQTDKLTTMQKALIKSEMDKIWKI